MKDNAKSTKDSESGYWLYGDGTVRWGIALVRHDEVPIKVDAEMKKQPVEARIEFYNATLAAKQKAEEDAKAKEKALEEKNAKALKK